uniref:Uncharacterized protein n=1 Tax=Ditylenchus dipsaci TaxID=166011 RepID=A0A915EBQ6_9BILA
MSDVLRQITASVAFLPLLENRCSFDVLVYTHRTLFCLKAGRILPNVTSTMQSKFQLRSFSTKVQSVHTKVQYKADL